jgi:hypothetical protein
MSRTGVLAAVAVVVGALALAAVGAWYVLLRDTAEPVTVAEAVTSFRTDTEPTPEAPSLIPEGVYVYETEGSERTDALTGATHRYPQRSTITVRRAGCGVSLLWQVLEGRSTEWTYCTGPHGWSLAGQDERHTFFGRAESTTYVCDEVLIRPATRSTGALELSCSTGTAEERGTVGLLGHELLQVAREPVATEHVRKTSQFTGEIRGTSRHDIWFDSESGVPVKLVMASRTTNDSPVGDVHYEERVTLRLTTLEPRR